MIQSFNNQKKTENEAVFREYNEKIQKGRDRVNKLAREDNQPDLIDDTNLMLQYLCECSDENCRSRIGLMLNTFNEIHTNRKWFVIVDGHESLEIETVLERRPEYTIVEKNIKPTEDNPRLRVTDADNS